MPVELVVFDMAGTTVTDNGNVKECFMDAFNQAGLTIPGDEVDTVMGFRKKDAIVMLLAKYYPLQKDNELLVDEIHFHFTSKMVSFYENDTALKPLPFAETSFRYLKDKGIKVALNTGFTSVITSVLLKKLHWDNSPLIDFVISSNEVEEGRPEPFMIEAIMNTLHIKDAAAVVKVGDTEVDVKEGRNAGCGMVISVTTGAYTKEQLQQYHPDFIIDSLEELPALIQ